MSMVQSEVKVITNKHKSGMRIKMIAFSVIFFAGRGHEACPPLSEYCGDVSPLSPAIAALGNKK